MVPLIELRGLTVEIPTPAGWIRPVDDVSFALDAGESLGLVGESGSGKSMLALALMGLLPPGARVGGEAWFSGANGAAGSRVNLLTLRERERIGVRGRDIAMIFQEPMTALNPVMRVGAQIAEAIRAHHAGLSREEVDRRVLAALGRAAVPEPAMRARQYPHQLSGGLRQRAMIAMALSGDDAKAPSLLIADEPTTALDVTVQKQILELLAQLRRDLGPRFFSSRMTSASSRRWRIASRSPMRGASWKRALRAKCLNARAIPIQQACCALRRNSCGTNSSRFPAPCRRSPRCLLGARLSRAAHCASPNAPQPCPNCAAPAPSIARAAF